MNDDDFDRILPVAVGIGFLGLGAALLRTKPDFLALPDPTPIADDSDDSLLASSAHGLRDQIARVMPENLATSLSRSLIITGAALIVVRVLDEISGK